MAGIYIHIPYCKKACHYCNFHFSTSLHSKNGLMKALLKEITLQQEYTGTESISTVYFGGGTPSLLSPEELNALLAQLAGTFTIERTAEITLEANPDDITPHNANAWIRSGINRLSIGVQSFFNEDLEWMNRAHNAAQAEQGIRTIREAGFDNFSIDLIYGTPTLTDQKWQQNVDLATGLQVPHISAYALTVEPSTPLAHLIKTNQVAPVSTTQQANQSELLMNWMASAGYEHYEISNFARPGFRSRHNSAYWDGTVYLGLGPAAHSFNGTERQWNVSNNALYIKAIESGQVPFEKETLTATQRLNEYIMTALRRKEGISLGHVRNSFNGATDAMLRNCRKYEEEGFIRIDADHLVLTNKGKLFADGIAADLFVS